MHETWYAPPASLDCIRQAEGQWRWGLWEVDPTFTNRIGTCDSSAGTINNIEEKVQKGGNQTTESAGPGLALHCPVHPRSAA